MSTKLTKLEACAQEVLKWRLRFENGLIDQDEFDAKLEATRAKCRKSYEQITEASTKFVDSVVAKCEEVTEFILGDVAVDYDALRFQALANELDSDNPVTSVEQLAGQLCGVKEVLVDVALTAQMPRALELLSYLGPEFVTINSDPTDLETPGEGLPNVPLDSRCLLATGTPMLQRLSPLLQRTR